MRIYTVKHSDQDYTLVTDGSLTIIQSALHATTAFNTGGRWTIRDEQGNSWEVETKLELRAEVVGPQREVD